MSAPRYVVGIDLGTTHCAVAASPVDRADVQLFKVPQLVAPGETAPRSLLPSFLYLPADGEFSDAQLRLPWGVEPLIVGEFARRKGAQAPVRMVASAKSWICHGGVDRRAPILPWDAPDEAPKISPFDASVQYLRHLRLAWDHAHPDAPLAAQDLTLTVPASFDGVACELTVAAAREAGLPQVHLLEEPQAAFYDFLGAHEADLDVRLADARLVLVVDVGGGTTDLTLVRVCAVSGGPPTLERIAVGGHLMLGGDNMDAALAHYIQRKAGVRERLDPTEWARLVQAARHAKERLLSADAPEEMHLSIQRRGSRLVGGTRATTLRRDEVNTVLLDGFFPLSARDDVASRKGRAGLTTLGLPYTTDAAIPRHINAFLRRHTEAASAAGAEVVDGLPRPDVVLVNGGVFNPPTLVHRLQAAISGWFDGPPIRLLAHTSLEAAVACGAARFALARRGLGQLITGGTARAYYVGVDGLDGVRRAFCVAPRGMEDGARVEVKDRVFDLLLDRPVSFPLYMYLGDRTDRAGALVDVTDELEPLPPIRTTLRAKGDVWVNPKTGGIPVNPAAFLTETGTLELSLSTVELPPRRWRLEFALNDKQSAPKVAPELATIVSTPLPASFSEARHLIEQTFNARKSGEDPRRAKALRRELERALGPRGQWSSLVCRALFGVLIKVAEQRGTTVSHEQTWLRLIGWALRPGFGADGDAARIDQLWHLFAVGLIHPKNRGLWTEWWVMWRRAAAGLDAPRQRVVFEAIRPWLGGGKRPPGPHAHGQPEMIRLLAALERLSAEQKQAAGGWFLERQQKVGSWWPLGRLGARLPFHGSATDVVPLTVATEWLDRLLTEDWASADGAAFAAVLLTRVTGHDHDIDAARRAEVVRRLSEAKAPIHWLTLLTSAAALSSSDARRIFGEALPAGLRLT